VRKVRSGGLLGLAAAAALLVGGVACSESDDDPSEDAGGGSEETEDETTTTEDAGSGSEDEEPSDTTEASDEGSGSGSGSGSEDEAPESLGSSTARLPAGPRDPTLVPLRLDVIAVERLEGMVELRVTITHEGDSRSPDFQPFEAFVDPRLPTGDGVESLSGAMLIDPAGERGHLAMVDSEGTCLCTGRLSQVSIPAGESYEMYADIGGLPDDLDQVDVQVPGFPTVGSVPVG
jgi:hypothetical protein